MNSSKSTGASAEVGGGYSATKASRGAGRARITAFGVDHR